MTPIESALLILVMALPAFWWMQRQVAQLSDPEYLRRHGVVIVLEKAIEGRSPPIGEYLGHPIWETVTFKGILYRFDHILESRKRERLEPGELFIEPGLVYVAEPPPA
ncbi:MAG TPA: hypothetical protein VG873_17760 [Burkholderiales bacterium]|nr:hypothetical protein [Burkholderiales bacterium]